MDPQPRPARAFEGRKRNSRIYHCGDGFFYNVRERRRNSIRLACRKRRTRGRGCPGTAVISRRSGLLHHLTRHTHFPDRLLEQDYAVRRAIVQEARENVDGTRVRSILDNWKIRVRNPELAMRFTRVRMASSLYAARAERYPRIPPSLMYLGVLLGRPRLRSICKTVDGTDYIFQGVIGCQQQQSVGLVFASGRMLQFLETKESIHVDGTFKKRPRKPKTRQIFSIVVKHGENVIGVVRVLMRRRTRAAYQEVFNFIKLIAPGFNPRRAHCDFEKAQIAAIRHCFPLCRVVGCLWHYCVCVGKKARKLGLAALAEENHLVFLFIASLGSLPLLPEYLIWEGVKEVWRDVVLSGWEDELQSLFEYIETEWKPRIPELSVFGDSERTNNFSETDNKMLANAIPQNFPNVWFCIGGFVKLEYISWCDKLAIDNLLPVAPTRRESSITNDRKVRMATQLLINGDISPGAFLQKISYSIHAATMYGLQLQDESDSDDD